jgi:RNA polymerase sigma factor (sigma-70 family)
MQPNEARSLLAGDRPLRDARSTLADAAFARFRCTGNPDDLTIVVDATVAHLRRVARLLTHDTDLADDLVQTTFLDAIDGAGSWNPAHPLGPWLVGILHNRARRWRRREGRRPDLRRIVRERPLPDPGETLAAHELCARVSDAIAAMPSTYRTVLELYLRNGLTPLEIAGALNRRRSTVRTQLARGLARLRHYLTEARC